MINQIMLVGTLTKTINKDSIKLRGDKTKFYKLSLEVRRPFKNHSGIYDYDDVVIYYWDEIIKHQIKRLIKNQIIAVKGRVESNDNQMFLIGEKLTLMPSAISE